ncbi:hypothetical protein ASF22_15630 [Methylobacterium sp. Leaf87]|uniref:hypothetical protein n=1 Tax=Methylobacterium sp. Leaf87 TaxID=1736243 RepID=UPI0006FF202A|nr:hypothetical protein [Methylobacterium sp. Leaf87]KQO71351.1 hypothetical protein ASF22_15630 [Methylobacterium sp. Leaf87]
MNFHIIPPPTTAQPQPMAYPKPPKPSQKFGLQEFARISGVKSLKLQSWQIRGAMKFAPIGTGNERLYTLWDAIHAAVILEMTKVGLCITADGADLSKSLAGYVRVHLMKHGHLDGLRPVVLWWDKGDLLMNLDPQQIERSGSYIVFGLREVATGVIARYVPG